MGPVRRSGRPRLRRPVLPMTFLGGPLMPDSPFAKTGSNRTSLNCQIARELWELVRICPEVGGIDFSWLYIYISELLLFCLSSKPKTQPWRQIERRERKTMRDCHRSRRAYTAPPELIRPLCDVCHRVSRVHVASSGMGSTEP